MGGVSIGDGAVIGTASVISHDVPPYAIMTGRNNHLKNRFSDEIIEALTNLKWWNLPFEVIKKIIPILAENPTIDNINEIHRIVE